MAQHAQKLEEMAAAIEATGDYRVLRRLNSADAFSEYDGTPTKLGIVVDVETTGLNSSLDEVIELGMIKFEYSGDGRIFRVVDRFHGIRQPGIPIPSEITDLTGISPQDVAGCSIDAREVAAFIEDAVIVIAHNAAFDRIFCERAWPEFAEKHWACSTSEIDWRAHGYGGAKLAYLLSEHGYFAQEHRALNDCDAVLTLLASASAIGRTYLAELLDNARRPSLRVFAEGAPFEAKELLKMRGYRWFEGSAERLKSWRKDVFEEDLPAELDFLRATVFGGRDVRIPVLKLTAADRYSSRGQ